MAKNLKSLAPDGAYSDDLVDRSFENERVKEEIDAITQAQQRAADCLMRLLLTQSLDRFQIYLDLNSGSMQSTYITPKNVGRWKRR
jgi:hypothetical protein